MTVFGIILLFIVLLLSVITIPFGVPGTFLIVIASLIYSWVYGFEPMSLGFLGILLALAVALEVVEELFGAYMAKRLGGSRYAVIGAITGGLAGAILGTPAAPVIGTLIGGFIGSFSGALLLEWLHTGNIHRAFRVGLGALFGAVGGKVTKIIVAVIMIVLVAFQIF